MFLCRTSEGIRRRGIALKRRGSLQESLRPVLICPSSLMYLRRGASARVRTPRGDASSTPFARRATPSDDTHTSRSVNNAYEGSIIIIIIINIIICMIIIIIIIISIIISSSSSIITPANAAARRGRVRSVAALERARGHHCLLFTLYDYLCYCYYCCCL